MSFSDETLMAFADGELDAATRHAIEEAMCHDQSIARRVEQHKALASRVSGAFAPILREPVPERLLQPVRTARVVQLDAVRARKLAQHGVPGKAAKRRRWSWPEWGALAATLIAGVIVGRFGMTALQADGQMASTVSGTDGTLMAQGKLAVALSQAGGTASAGAAPADAGVRIGLSFMSNDGAYCRSFTLGNAGQSLAGLACRSGSEWKIPALIEAAKPATPAGTYRMAAVEMPVAILEAIDQRISGAALDARAEQEALRQGWRR